MCITIFWEAGGLLVAIILILTKNNVLKDSGIYWQSCGFNDGSDSLTFIERKVRRKFNYPTSYFGKLTNEQVVSQHIVGKYLHHSNYPRMVSQLSSYLPSLTFFKLIARKKAISSNIAVIAS